MIMFWITLFALRDVYTLAPVVSVQLGESVTLPCVLAKTVIPRREIYWYRQSAGETLKLIVSLRVPTKAEYSGEISESRLKLNEDNNSVNLTILKTTLEDEGLYHCEIMEWTAIPKWTGTYLLVKGNSERTSNYSVIQRSTVSDPARSGDSVSLQCSVLSDSDNKTCPGGHSVYWFRTGSDKSHPHIIYTDVNDECEQRSDSVKSCVYRFSKNVSVSDAGTYHCAVASCGRILFGDGTSVDIYETIMWTQAGKSFMILLCLFLAGVMVLGFVFCSIKHNQNAAFGLPKTHQGNEAMWVHTTVVFTEMKPERCGITNGITQRARSYAAVKAFGLDQ